MSVFKKLAGTTASSFAIGIGAAGNKSLLADQGAINTPAVRYNDATKLWELSDNGVNFSPVFHQSFANEVHALTPKTSPVGADELVLEDSGASWAKKRVSLTNLGLGIALGYLSASATNAPTTNLGYPFNPPTTVVPGMSLVAPANGSYRFIFNCEWQGSTAATVAAFAAFANNGQATASLRRSRVTAGGAWMNLMLEAEQTGVLAGQVLEIDWVVDAGAVLTVQNRYFSILKVA